MEPKQDYRASNGNGRIHYDPAWSPSRPFQTFRGGTATNSFQTLEQALIYMAKYKYEFNGSKWQ